MPFAIIRMAGRVILVGGVLVLLFIPYLLWGTGLMTARSQTALRQEFGLVQKESGARVPTHIAVPPKTPAGPTAPQVAPNEPDPPIGSPVGTIDIPKIGLSMVVVEGTGTAQLEQGPGHYPGTPLPGEAGNVAIAGHRTTYLHPFYSLDALGPGDSILLTTLQGFFLYHVTSSQAVAPTDVAVVDPTPTPTLTLTTCNPRYSASQRLVVHASLVASYLVHVAAAPAVAVHRLKPVPSQTPPKSWPTAIAWAVAVAALTTGLWIAARRSHRWLRAAVVGGGTLVWLVVVFYLFQAAAPLLPASF